MNSKEKVLSPDTQLALPHEKSMSSLPEGSSHTIGKGHYGLNCPPQNPYVETLTLRVVVFEDGVFGRWLGIDEVMRMRSS